MSDIALFDSLCFVFLFDGSYRLMSQQLNFLWKNHRQVKYQRLVADSYDCSGKKAIKSFQGK